MTLVDSEHFERASCTRLALFVIFEKSVVLLGTCDEICEAARGEIFPMLEFQMTYIVADPSGLPPSRNPGMSAG